MDTPTTITIITAAIAALVGFITLKQWLTDRARLKHELFDRRYAIYEKIAAFPSDILISGNVQPGADQQFLKDTKLAYFAFGCDESVKGVVDRLYKLAIDLHAAQVKLQLDREHQLKKELSHVSQSLPDIFTKYLKLAH